jgi:WbqC-like protein family
MNVIFPIVYAGNIHYFSQLKNCSTTRPTESSGRALFDLHEHYIKQTYRNRCTIYGANGRLDLIIPIEKGKHGHQAMKDVKISYDGNWQKMHWRSLESAYRSSPYFEYYEHEFIPFYEKKTDYLVDFNLVLHEKLNKLLDIPNHFVFTEKYAVAGENFTDERKLADPFLNLPETNFKNYTQVFESKLEFIPNLSVIDLLVNCGPESGNYL